MDPEFHTEYIKARLNRMLWMKSQLLHGQMYVFTGSNQNLLGLFREFQEKLSNVSIAPGINNRIPRDYTRGIEKVNLYAYRNQDYFANNYEDN